MVVYAFYIFDRHGESHRSDYRTQTHMAVAECIYKKNWQLPTGGVGGKGSRPPSQTYVNGNTPVRPSLTADDDAKLIFGTIYSLRNMVRKLGGEDDRCVGPGNCGMAY